MSRSPAAALVLASLLVGCAHGSTADELAPEASGEDASVVDAPAGDAARPWPDAASDAAGRDASDDRSATSDASGSDAADAADARDATSDADAADARDVGVDVGVDAGAVVRACPAGTFVIGIALDGTAVCSTLAGAVRGFVDGSCSAYLGWRDSCNGCSDPPTKWGSAGATSCANGAGVDDVCIAPTADGQTIQLFGVNADGDVNDDDKFYVGLRCEGSTTPAASGDCPLGQFATSFSSDGKPSCADPSAAARDAIHRDCFVYAGWQDSCNGCTSAPKKWDRTTGDACENLVGPNGDQCIVANLGGDDVRLLGLDFDGNVDANDEIYLGMRCVPGTEPAPPPMAQACADGEAATGFDGAGKLVCAPVAPAVHAWFAKSCWLYLGWQDSCGGCSSPPTKWGRVSESDCANGVGADATCATYTLGAVDVPMFGLNPDGNVDDNDMLHFGLRCF